MDGLIVISTIVLLSALIVGFQGFREQKKQRALAEKWIREEYGTAPIRNRFREEASIKSGSASLRSKAQENYHLFLGEKEIFLDDITWNDLDMELIFERLNYSRCSAGAEELYRMLRYPVMEREILLERNALADGMGEFSLLREQLSFALYEIGFTGKYALEEYLNYLENLEERSNLKHILLDVLYLPAIAVMFWEPALGTFALFLVLMTNIMTYFKEKGEINPYLVSFAYILRMIRGAEKIGGILEKANRNGSLKVQDTATEETKAEETKAEETKAAEVFAKYQDILKKDVKELGRFKSFSQLAMSMSNPMGSSGPLDLLFDYMKMAFHPDLMKFNQMLKIIREKDAVIREMVSAIGMLDACLSIAYFRASLKSFCRPEIDRSVGLVAEEIYHPLLEHPVKNSIDTERGVLITGSNASGKSTFLKTMALGAVLAQTMDTVPAKYWSAPFYQIMSSMALRDNLTGGESYFMVEIKALKRILDACDDKMPVLCFVDEVLRGTNTIERIAASGKILQSLTGKNVLCFAATHDIELTHLLENEYENYHFEETIEKGDISFHYLLKKGRAQSRNAIRLLEAMGYDESVVREAEELAERFLETGEWK